MAKVMVSFPDELLARLDARARESGKTRSGLLQELAARELQGDAEARLAQLEELWARADAGPGFGGKAVEWIREDRRSH